MRDAMSAFTVDSIRSGPDVVDTMADVVRASGCGRALVLYDSAAAVALVKRALERGGVQWRCAEVTDAGREWSELAGLLDSLRELSGGLIVTVGTPRVIAVGKGLATAANNGGKLTDRIGGRLPRSPLPHIAVPTEVWPPAEVTDVLEVGPAGLSLANPAQVIRDPRLAPVAIIDYRLHPLPPPAVVTEVTRLAVSVAACAATDESRSLAEQTMALAAAHALTASPLTEGAGLTERGQWRTAVSLAVAAHPDYVLCRRCAAGHRLRDEGIEAPATPAEACLRFALVQR